MKHTPPSVDKEPRSGEELTRKGSSSPFAFKISATPTPNQGEGCAEREEEGSAPFAKSALIYEKER